MKDEALDKALEALDNLLYWDNGKPEYDGAREAITAIKQALAAPTVQEPVYQIRHYGTNTVWHDVPISAYVVSLKENRRILYTTRAAVLRPVAKSHKWVGLTEEELDGIYAANGGTRTRKQIAAAIEAKLKGKNT